MQINSRFVRWVLISIIIHCSCAAKELSGGNKHKLNSEPITFAFTADSAGLFSNLSYLLEWIYCVKNEKNMRLYINLNGTYRCNGNAFPYFFQPFDDPQITTAAPEKTSVSCRGSPRCYPNFKKYPSDGMKNFENALTLHRAPALFKDPDFSIFRNRLQPIILKYFKLQHHLQERIDQIAHKMNESDDPTLKIGVHVRCTYKYKECNKTPDQFLDDIERDLDKIVQSKKQPVKIYLATLLQPLVDRLSAKYDIVVSDIARVNDVHTDWVADPNTNNLNAAYDAIVDAWCLANCDELWGTTSNVVLFVGCISPSLQINILPSLEQYEVR